MSILRDNKILIHNVYKRIKQQGTNYIKIGGKANRVHMVVRSKYNRKGMQYDVVGLAVALEFKHCIIKENGNIVSIGIDSTDRDACYLDMRDGFGYTLRELMLNRLFTVDVAANQQLYNEFTYKFTSDYSFNVNNGIRSVDDLKDYIGSSIDTSLWRKISSSKRINGVSVDDLLKTIKGSKYYQNLSNNTDYLINRLEDFFFDSLLSLKDTLGFNRKAGFDNFIPIISFDFSKKGRVKFYTSSNNIIDVSLEDVDIEDMYRAIAVDKMLSSAKVQKDEFTYEQYTVIVGD